MYASARQLANHLNATVESMKILARTCGRDHLSRFGTRDLTMWKRETADLTGVRYAGVG